MRIIFMGTPDFAVSSLDILVQNGYDIVGVITSVDKYGGRGNKKRLESAVKKYAVANNLNILQPKNLKNAAFVEEVRALKADLQVVVAFRMLPEVIWNMPPLGTINLHASLLPKYRGAAPINWAIIRGEKESGVTSFKLKHEIDTGNMIFQEKIAIAEDETVGEVHDKMMLLGANVVLKTVQAIASGTVQFIKQDETQVTKAPKIHHDTCAINFEQSIHDIHNFVRGLSPYPTAWMMLQEQKLKVFRTQKELVTHNIEIGKWITDNKTYLKIAARDGFLHLLDIQLQGRKRMPIKAFLNGYQFKLD